MVLQKRTIKQWESKWVLLGDSIIKHINGYELPNQEEKINIYTKSYTGSEIRCMKNHVKPTSRMDADHIILHVDTNNLPTRKTSHEIAKSIMQLAPALKAKSCDASILSITARNDHYRNKATEGYLVLRVFTCAIWIKLS